MNGELPAHPVLRRFARLILAARVPILAVTVLAFLTIGSFVTKLKTDNSYDIWYKPGSHHIETYKHFLGLFGGEETFVAMLHSPDIFKPETLRLVREIESIFEAEPDIISTASLLSVEKFDSINDSIVARPMAAEIPTEAAGLKALRDDLMANPFYKGLIISDDGQATLVSGTIRQMDMKSKTETCQRLAAKVHALIDGHNGTDTNPEWPPAWTRPLLKFLDPLTGGYAGGLLENLRDPSADYHLQLNDGTQVVFTGQPILDTEFNRLSVRDGEVFFPAVMLASGLTLFLLFRRPAAVFFPFLVVLGAMFVTLGLYVANGNTLNMITTVLPALFTAMGIANSVHIFTQYNEEISAGRPQREAVEMTIVRMAPPCFFAAVTSAIGFLSFSGSEIQPTQTLGTYAAIGIMLAFLFSIMSIPALLTFLPPPKARVLLRQEKGLMARSLSRLATLVIRRHKRVVIVSALLGVVAIIGILQVRVETQVILFLKDENPVRRAFDEIHEHFGGIISHETMLTGPPGVFKDPDILRRVEDYQNFLESDARHPLHKTVSPVDYLKELHKVVASSGPEEYERNRRLPDSSAAAAQLFLFMEMSGGSDIFQYVSPDFSTARVNGRAGFMSSEEAAKNIHAQEAYLAELFKDTPVKAEVTGLVKLFVSMDETLLKTQFRSFGISFVLIAVCMIMLTRSLKIGLVAMVPNLLPIIITLGLMGFAGFTLDVATTMIASIALAIAVDDTIHFLSRFRSEFKTHGKYDMAIRRSFAGVGSAVTSTSLILMVGFGVLSLGSFIPTSIFGILTAFTMVTAVMGDLILMPALLKWTGLFGKESGSRTS